ncbi:MAG TPA: hypothetical protein VFN57_06815 [Thermomicrobiaceae bacterium]|nr:hypothetical protein [Thermomicrobiaceae bacterium]
MEQRIGRRVNVIGDSNAGKSTLAEQLAARWGVPFVELDALHWEPGWVEADLSVFRERVRRAIEPDGWVVAGNYRSTVQDITWAAADTVVWLDLGLPTLISRCLARSWRRWRSGELLWGTNRERFWDQLMLWDRQKSLIAFTLWTHGGRRRAYAAAMADPRWAHLRFVRLRSAGEVQAWLSDVLAEGAPGVAEATPGEAPAGSAVSG